MGNKRITAQNLAIVRIDTSLDLIFVRGAVPGVDDAHVLIRDAKKKMTALSRANQAKGLFEKILPTGVDDMPFPAGTAEMARVLPPIIETPSYRRSPFVPQE
jgi:large subunit ribosomal protein L3